MERNGITAENTGGMASSGMEAVTEIVGAGAPEVDALRRGTTVGRYVVLGKLGQGGMGAVYSAYDPELDRKVAVKVLRYDGKRDADGTIARTRFLREAQSMAKLSHPNVAAVYDVGTMDEHVFIAMEFVDGLTLRAFLGQEDPPWRRIVSTFAQAGAGLIAAHAAGIIHRDFKPENVMVDADGRAVVLDFGLARPTSEYNSRDASAAESNTSASMDGMLTTTGTVMGTPHYMAPEQHRGAEVDERSDQFAFCVALYEALYKRRPFAGRNAKMLAINVVKGRLRPPPPSKVPRRIERAVLRGLSNAGGDRHPSMRALLRVLKSRRRRIGGAAIAAIAVGSAGVAAASGVLLGRGPKPCADADAVMDASWGSEQRAQVREAFTPHAKADGTETFARVVKEVDAYAGAWRDARRTACEAARVRDEESEQVLELRYACLDRARRRFDALVEVFGAAQVEVVFGAMGMVRDLPPLADCSDLELLRRVLPPPDNLAARREVGQIRDRLAVAALWADAGDLERVEQELDALELRAKEVDYPPVLAEVLGQRGQMLVFTGRVDEADAAAERSLLLSLAHAHDDGAFRALLLQAVISGNYRNRFDVAEVALARAEAMRERLGGGLGRRTSLNIVSARLLNLQGRDAEAAALYEEVLAASHELGGSDGPVAITARATYGMLLVKLDRTEEARTVLEEAIVIASSALGEHHPAVATATLYLARVETVENDHAAALAAVRRAKAIFFAALGEGHSNAIATLNAEALVLDHMGEVEQAKAVLRKVGDVARANYGENLNLASILQNLGSAQTRTGEAAQAVATLTEALEIKAESLGDESASVGYSNDLLGEAYIELVRWDDAQRALQRSVEILGKAKGTDHPDLGRPTVGLGEVALGRGDMEAARRHFERARVLIEPDDTERDVARARASFGLARVLGASGEPAQARALAEEARAILAPNNSAAQRLASVTAWLASTG